MRVTRRPAAKRDVIELATFIAGDSPQAASRFVLAVRESIGRIGRWPGTGSQVELDEPLLAGIRKWPVVGFPNHLIFYRQTDKTVEVIRILHGARDIPHVLRDEMAE